MGVLAADLHGHTHARAHTGNPCVDPYICQDWENRFAVATANATNVPEVDFQKAALKRNGSHFFNFYFQIPGSLAITKYPWSRNRPK